MRTNQRRTEHDIECGYFDPGGRRSKGGIQFLQPGCTRRIITEVADIGPGDVERSAISQPIYAAETPVDDPAWNAAERCTDPKSCEPTE